MTMEVIPTLGRLGRGLINHDPKSWNYRAVEVIDTTKPRSKTWRRGQAYNQHNTPHCVAFTGKGLLNSSPHSAAVPYDVRIKYSTDEFYTGAQHNDEWPGEAYEGTSGLGLCRYLKSKGLIAEYRWCFGLNDVLLALSYLGPVGIGVWWKTSMWDVDNNGYLNVYGANEGGHEIELIGVDVEDQCVIAMNSWGPDWGVDGRFKMSFGPFEELLAEQGDAFVITKLHA